MIIMVRGTSGSGKSTVVRKVMDNFTGWGPHYVGGRKRPYFYSYKDLVAVVGSYDAICGGGDTIGSAPKCYEAIDLVRHDFKHVIAEGLLLSEDSKWSQQLPYLYCLFLTTPIETCIQRIKQRRLEVGNEKPLNESNTRNRVGVIERARTKLLDLGIECKRVSCEQAVETILKILKE